MPYVSGLLLKQSSVLEIICKANAIAELLDVKVTPLTSLCDLGQIYSAAPEEKNVEDNLLASELRVRASNGLSLSDLAPLRGNCFLVGVKEGKPARLSLEAFAKATEILKQINPKVTLLARRFSKTVMGPKKPPTDKELFAKQFRENRRIQRTIKQMTPLSPAELRKETDLAWSELKDEEKGRYSEEAKKEKKAYEENVRKYKENNPTKPPGVKSAYHFYFKEQKAHPELGKWADLTDEAKRPYEEKAVEDKLRFEQDYQVYKEQCQKVGKPCEEATRKRQAKSPGATKPPAKKRKPAAPKPAKRKVEEEEEGPEVISEGEEEREELELDEE